MAKELFRAPLGTDISIQKLLELVELGCIPEDAWLSFRTKEGGLIGIKTLSITDRDPEMGDIDLILEGR